MSKLLMAAVFVSCASISQAGIVWWSGDSGIAPWDSSLPPERRFDLWAPSPVTVTFGDGLVHVDDNSGNPNALDGNVYKGVGPVSASWAFQTELRVNSHQRPIFDWAAATGISDGARVGQLLISRDAVGFTGYNGHSFVNGQFVALDTTNAFHVYRVVKEGGFVNLFVDSFASPALTIPYNDLVPDSRSPFVTLLGTSGGGVANFDVHSHGFNLDGTAVPEPASLLLLVLGGLAVIRRRTSIPAAL